MARPLAAAVLLATACAPSIAAPVATSPTGTATVVRTDVEQRTQTGGEFGYAPALTVTATTPGVLTRLPKLGATVRRGQPVYELDGIKTPLLYGSRPAWREFALGMTDGRDVEQLERNLKALGHDPGTVDRHFSLATHYALFAAFKVRRLHPVFLPGDLRVGAHRAALGARVGPGSAVLDGTGRVAVVNLQLEPGARVRVGDRVLATLPGDKQRSGRVMSVSPVAVTEQDRTLVPVVVRLTGRVTGLRDRSLVQVVLTAERHRKVLAVPLLALLARPGGGYDVATARGRVPVELGLFDDVRGLVEVTGVHEGDVVEVAR